jgi:acyl-CoA synthetase (AMP-forming)/AMP-acid ligase II
MSSENDNKAQIFGVEYESEVKDLWDLFLEGHSNNPHGLAFAALHQDRNHIQLPSGDTENISSLTQNLEWTFEDLKNAAEALASSLQLRGATHSVIAAFLFPTAEWALSKWAAAKLAAPFAPLDPRMLAREEDVKAVLELLNADSIIVHDDDAATKLDALLQTLDHQPTIKVICSPFAVSGSDWIPITSLLNPISLPNGSDISRTNGSHDANASPTGRILFTGGSTGQPKACEHSVSNLYAESAGYSSMRDLSPASRTLIQSPCNHIMACAAALLTWRAGAAVIFPAQTFNPRASLEAIEQYGVTYLPVHHSMTDALIADPAFEPRRVASVRYLQVGGALIGADLLERYAQAFIGAKVFPFWGMTEGMYTTANGLQDEPVLRDGILAVGVGQPGSKVRVADPETNTVCRRNEVGELHIGGPTVIARYMHDASPDSFYEDQYGRWFKSGDQGVIDGDGRVHMLGRYKDVIKRGGENCYPSLAEHHLMSKAGLKVSLTSRLFKRARLV